MRSPIWNAADLCQITLILIQIKSIISIISPQTECKDTYSRGKSVKKRSIYANESTLEPIYFDSYPSPQYQHHQDQRGSVFMVNHNKHSPINSFYAVDDEASEQHEVSKGGQLAIKKSPLNQPQSEIHMLQQFPIDAQINQQQQQQFAQQHLSNYQQPYSNEPAILQNPNYNDINLATIQDALVNFNRQAPPRASNQHQNDVIQIPKLNYMPYPASYEQNNNNVHHVRKNEKLASIPTKQVHYKPSILHRPKQVVNLSSLLQPGQVLLTEKDHLTSGEKLSSTNMKEIENLMQKLKPFQVKDVEKPTETSDYDETEEDSDEVDQRRIKELRRQKKLGLVLPSSHIFGNLIGVVNESRILNQDTQDKLSSASNDDQVSFLRALAELSSNLGYDQDLARQRRKKESAKQQREPMKEETNDNNDSDFFEILSDPRLTNKVKQERYESQEFTGKRPSIPIDVLVDHLMSSSRGATFGLQHDDNQALGGLDDETGDSDEEGEEDEDSDNNGTLPLESHGNIDAYESHQMEVRVLPAEASNIVVDFDSIKNQSDSWIPLTRFPVLKRAASSQQMGKDSNKTENSVKEEKKKKRPRRSKGNDLLSTIGRRKLSRTDLIRLIGVLNKMASEKKPSKEREASRKLLKFLIKIAFAEYKKAQKAKQESDDRTKDLLRSVLMKQEDKPADNGVIELKSIGLVPDQRQIKPQNKREEIVEYPQQGLVNPDKSPDIKDVHQKEGTLRDLSDELETYFDGDFFEDMADKLRTNNTNAYFGLTPEAKSSSQQHFTTKRRRNSRTPYGSLPIPIYGHQMLEEADEDDVELDHIRVPLGRKRSELKKARKEKRKRGKKGKRTASDKKKRRRDEAIKEEEANVDEEEPEEEEEDVQERPENEGEAKQRKARGKAKFEEDKDSPAESKNSDTKQEESKVDNELNDQDPDEEPDPPEREKVADKIGKGVRKSEKDHVKEEEEPKPEPATSKKRKPQAKKKDSKTKKKKKKRKRRVRSRKTKKKFEIDLDSRYEIPAPIQAGKMATLDSNRKTNTTAVIKSVKASSSKDVEAMEPKSKTKRNEGIKKSGEMKKRPLTKRKDRSTRQESKMKSVDTDEPRTDDGEGDDQDYYNEGTSYSKVCDDDGKCQVKVQSTSPILSKAIENGNKPLVERQLDKWAQSNVD